jgi:hypothetical protein
MRRKPGLRNRFWVETGLGALTAILTVVTLISHEWIEIVFGVDPDRGSGLLEWGIVVALAAATLLFSLLARAEWRQAATNPSQ